MNAAEYAAYCSRPDVMRRPDIRATIVRLSHKRPDLAQRLEKLSRTPPIPKPDRHLGGSDSDAFVVDLSREELEAIVEELGDLEASLAEEETTVRPLLSTAATLLDKWNGALRVRSDAA